MLAVVCSVLLTLYLIVPEAIFRTIFSYFIPEKHFVLTRTEKAYRAVLVTILPLGLALLASWYAPVTQHFPFPVEKNTVQDRRGDYTLVLNALYSEHEFEKSPPEFWHAATRCIRRQARLIVWYLLLVGLEAWGAGFLVLKYAKYKKKSLYKWFSNNVLFPFISEWYPLLTPQIHLLPGTRVQADLLCTNDTLYQGFVAEHFVQDGKLTGIILDEPKRFERKLYLKEREGGKSPDKKLFWIPIPSEHMYFFSDKIVNINLTYISATGTPADAEAVRVFVSEVLGRSIGDDGKITISLKPEKPPNRPGS